MSDDPLTFETVEDAREHLVDRRQMMGQEGSLTQKEVARVMGAYQGYVSTFERGVRSREPFLSTVQKYAKAQGLRLRLVLEPIEPSDCTSVSPESGTRCTMKAPHYPQPHQGDHPRGGYASWPHRDDEF